MVGLRSDEGASTIFLRVFVRGGRISSAMTSIEGADSDVICAIGAIWAAGESVKSVVEQKHS